MKTEIIQFTGFKGINLPAVIWQPEGEIKAVLQVTHGMTEHMGRYERFAADLCSQGVAVAAELRVSQLQPYRDIAFFHHLILGKKEV